MDHFNGFKRSSLTMNPLTHFSISLECPVFELFLSGVPRQLDFIRVCGPRSKIMVEVAVAMTATASRTLASML